ncbi:MAG: hypothetical protein NT091_00715 [Candidatus Falkowbacteria bacterium]|nr:hypothetical protein [Candidatus Falkowbacteria bacterium]
MPILKKYFKQFSALACLMTFLMVPYFVFATTMQENLSAVGGSAGMTTNTKSLPEIIGGVISVFLGFLGVIFVVLLLLAGFKYMMAAGDSKKVEEALGSIRTAIIGIVITLSAYAISSFVIESAIKATTGT